MSVAESWHSFTSIIKRKIYNYHPWDGLQCLTLQCQDADSMKCYLKSGPEVQRSWSINLQHVFGNEVEGPGFWIWKDLSSKPNSLPYYQYELENFLNPSMYLRIIICETRADIAVPASLQSRLEIIQKNLSLMCWTRIALRIWAGL